MLVIFCIHLVKFKLFDFSGSESCILLWMEVEVVFAIDMGYGNK
jgi:hypothetical protein